MAEGYAREIIRRIQDMRKELDLKVEDPIRTAVRIDDQKILSLVQGQKGYIANEVRASSLDMERDLEVKGSLVKDWDIEDLQMKIGIERI